MHGPKPAGFWTTGTPPRPYGQLTPGTRYEVLTGFVDYDGVAHPAGESWTFLGYNFLPYDDGLSLFVSLDGKQEWHIRLQDRPEEQGAVADAIHEGKIVRAIGRRLQAASPEVPRVLRWDKPVLMSLCAGLGAIAGGVPAAFAGKGSIALVSALVCAAIVALPVRTIWRRSQWRMLLAALPTGTSATAVEALLGNPTARIDLFSTGKEAATHVFEPAIYTPAKFKGSLACDFDSGDKLLAIRRL